MRRGRSLVIAWRDEAATLYRRYQQETRPDLRPRWHALWRLRTGGTVRELAALATDPARLQRLIGWDWIAASLAQLPADYPAPS